jgi:hypothetical protein
MDLLNQTNFQDLAGPRARQRRRDRDSVAIQDRGIRPVIIRRLIL